MTRHIAIYVRVSSRQQSTKSQEPDLLNWAKSQIEPNKWYRDKATGKSMDRPNWNRLEAAIRSGKVSTVVVWRLDRLGRTAAGLTALFSQLRERKVNLVSIKDGIDLSTAAGRMVAGVLASIAQYETEVRGERVAAGIAVARAKGKRWGGSIASKPGVRKCVGVEQEKWIRQLHQEGTPIARIARVVGFSRPTIYDVIKTK